MREERSAFSPQQLLYGMSPNLPWNAFNELDSYIQHIGFFLGFWKHKCFQVHPQNITLETAAVSFLSHDGVSVDGGGFWAVYDEYK